MVRTYNRKNEKVPREILISALRELKLLDNLQCGNLGYRKVAESYGIPKSTLFKHYKQVKDLDFIPDNYFSKQVHHLQILKFEEEEELVEYLKLAMQSNHSLTPSEVRKLVYSFVVGNGIQCPAMWHENHTAGEDWFTSFMKRNNCLSLRKAEATSQAQAAGFNYPIVHTYQLQLGGIFVRHKYPPDRIFNIDETSDQTVMGDEMVVAIRGTKQVRQTTGAERGTNVSMICFANAAGGVIPPAFVFPLKKVNRKSMNNSVPGSIAFANGTGWFDGNIMVDVIDHFQQYVKSSKENPVLIIWDNFSAHLDYRVVKKAKEYGMEIITLPPHTSHELQPLDVSVFVAMKKYIKAGHMAWYRNNPGKRITIHEVAGLTKDPFYKAMTPTNLISGFKRAGIYPFIMFEPDDPRFSSALVTDLPDTSQQQIAEALVVDEMHTPHHSIEIEFSNNIHTVESEDDGAGFNPEEENVITLECSFFCNTELTTEVENLQPMPNNESEIVEGVDGVSQERAGNCETSGSTNVTVKRVRLEEIMPIPKVIQDGPRQKKRTRIGRSRVLTDPEEMNQLQLDYLKKQEKEQNKDKCKKSRSAKPLLSNKENISGKGKLVAGKSNMNSVPEKEPLKKTRSVNPRLSNKENIPVAGKSNMNSVPEKDPLKKTRSANPRLSNNENIPEKDKLVAGKNNLISVQEKEPLVVLNRQPRVAKKPAFLTQNYLFD